MALVEGWQIPRIPPNSALRRQLYDEAAGGGADALHSRLRDIDPVAAASIDSRNIRRVVRALEICLESGRRVSDLRGKNPTPYEVLMVGLTLPRDELYRRIDQRVDKMIECGLEQEVRGLVSAGYGFDLPAMSGLGYAQFAPLLRGEATLAEVVQAVKRATRRFVRQQANWFRPDDSRIHWYGAAPDPTDKLVELVSRFLDATT